MTDPEEALQYLIDRVLRRTDLAPGGRMGPDDAALDTLHELVAAKLGGDPALTQLEAAVARLRMVLRWATDNDPEFAVDLSTALAAVRWGPGPGVSPGGYGRAGYDQGGNVQGGYDQGVGVPPWTGGGAMGGSPPPGYAVEDVWVDEREQEDPPDSTESSPRT